MWFIPTQCGFLAPVCSVLSASRLSSWEPEDQIHPEVIATYFAGTRTTSIAATSAKHATKRPKTTAAPPPPISTVPPRDSNVPDRATVQATVQRGDEPPTTELCSLPDERRSGNGVYISNGDVVDVLQQQGDWTQVAVSRHKRGYLCSAYLV